MHNEGVFGVCTGWDVLASVCVCNIHIDIHIRKYKFWNVEPRFKIDKLVSKYRMVIGIYFDS